MRSARVYRRPAPLSDVLEEHLEEAAFLYAARQKCFRDGRFPWERCATLETRLDAHLHALGLGGRPAADLLEPKLLLDADGDPGEAFVAGAVLPALGLVGPVEALAEALEDWPPHRRAVLDGLRYAALPSIDPWLRDFLRAGSPALRAAGAEVAPARLPDAPTLLRAALLDRAPEVQLTAAACLAQMGQRVEPDLFAPLLDPASPALALPAAAVALASGDERALAALRAGIGGAEPALLGDFGLLLAVAGDLGDFDAIRRALGASGDSDPTLLEALGLSGSAAAFEVLLPVLEEPVSEDRFRAAWLALGTLTGRRSLPEFDLEDDDGEPARRYAREWGSWWKAARSGVAPGLKYRGGRLLSPASLVKDLVRPGNTRRDLAFLELAARYLCPLPFDPEARYEVQAAQLSALSTWAAQEERKFQPGAATFAGRAR